VVAYPRFVIEQALGKAGGIFESAVLTNLRQKIQRFVCLTNAPQGTGLSDRFDNQRVYLSRKAWEGAQPKQNKESELHRRDGLTATNHCLANIEIPDQYPSGS